MNPGQDDVVSRALETSCTQPQLDVWTSQMGRAWGPGAVGIPLKAPTELPGSELFRGTKKMALANDFPDTSGILMNFGISGVRPVTL